MRDLAVVGDIHGEAEALGRALAWLRRSWTGAVVFVGDYVDRGPSSREVLDMLIAWKAEHSDRTTFLRGNHDVVLRDFVVGSRSVSDFVVLGGLTTARSYLGANPPADAMESFRRTFPADHLAFLNDLQLAHESPEVLVTHAGYDVLEPERRDEEAVAFGRQFGLLSHDRRRPAPLVVCGHYVQANMEPFAAPGFVCVDTGCGSLPGAPLTVLCLPDMTFKTFGGDL